MSNESPAQTPLAQILSGMPAEVAALISHKLSSIINYEPVIGLMGKTGAGKSSLCNTLFSPPPAKVDAVRGCTRHIQRYQVRHDSRILYIMDFPGIGETPELDRIYCRLYREESPGLDLVVWLLKADDGRGRMTSVVITNCLLPVRNRRVFCSYSLRPTR